MKIKNILHWRENYYHMSTRELQLRSILRIIYNMMLKMYKITIKKEIIFEKKDTNYRNKTTNL